MGDTEIKQNQELDQLKDTLGNKKLDSKELNFLKGQKELLLDFKQSSELLLLGDIKETNKLSFEKSDKVRGILNSFLIDSDDFLKQLKLTPKESKKIKDFMTYMTNTIKSSDRDFYKQIFCVSLLFDKLGYKSVLSTGNLKLYDLKLSESTLKYALFNQNFVRALYSFQSKYSSASSTKGFSESDCIIGYKTVQQLCNMAGVKPSAGNIQIDSNLSQSNFNAKNNYNRAKESQTQINDIMNDAGLNNVQKVKSMVEVCKKTTTKASDGSDKRYAAVSYMISNIQTIMPNVTGREQESIIQELSTFAPEINKYWNEENSNSKVKKTNDFLKDLNKGIEKRNENSTKFSIIYDLCKTRVDFYNQVEDNDDIDIQHKNQMKIALLAIGNLKNRTTNVSELELKEILDKLFVSTAKDDMIQLGSNDSQEAILNTIKTFMVNYTTLSGYGDQNAILKLRNDVLGKYRKIDAHTGAFASMEGYKTTKTITENIENQNADQSLNAMMIDNPDKDADYANLNTDLSKLNQIFSKLEGDNPDKDIMDNIYAVMVLLDHSNKNIQTSYPITLESGIIVNPGAINKFRELFGFQLSATQRQMLYNTVQDIEKNKQKFKNEHIKNFKSNLGEANKELSADMARYQSEINHFKQINPSDPRINEYENNIKQLGLAIINNNNGIQGKPYQSSIDPNDPSKGIESITIDTKAELLTNNMNKYMFIKALEKSATYHVIDNNAKAVDKLKKKPNKTPGENMIDLYSNIKGVGSYRSDETYNTVLEVTKEIIIQVAICAISAGVGSLVLKGAMAGTKAILNGVKAANAANKLGKFYKIGTQSFSTIKRLNAVNKLNTSAKILNYTKAVASRAVNLTIEGSAFHASSTILNNAIAGNHMLDGLALTGQTVIGYDESGNPITHSNIRGYIQSIAFLGIIKAVGGSIQKSIADKFTKGTITQTELNGVLNQTVKLDTGQKIIMNTASLGGEFASMGIADQAISFGFDGKFKEMSTKDLIHMGCMIIGLRLTHKLNMFGGVNKKLDEYIVKDIKKGTDGLNIELLTLEVTRDSKTYETVLNSKGEVVRTTDPMLRQGMEVKVDELGARSEISNRSPANRNNTADYIAKNRYENGNNKTNEGIPTEVQIRNGEKVKIDHNGKYKDIIDQYKDLIQKNKENPNLDITSELSKLDMQLAERITLDKGKSIEYTSEAEARSSFEQLSKIQEYDGTLRTYKNFEGKRCVEKLSSNTIMPNIYISVKGMEGRRGVDYTGATIKSFEIPINNLKTGDQIFTEFGGKRYEFAKKENGNREVISEGSRFEKGNEVKLNKNEDGTMTFERIGDARKMEVSEIGLKKFASSQSEVIIKDVVDAKQIENLVENFDAQIMLDKGITIDGKNYKLIYEPNMTQNQNRKGTWKFIVDGKVEISAQAETKVLPENSNGNRIREKYYELRDKYVSTEIAKSGKEVKVEVKQVEQVQQTPPQSVEQAKPEVKVESKPAEPVRQPESSALATQIKYLENQRIEMEKQYNSKKNKTPDDIKTFNQNMDAYNQKIEALKVEQAKLESQQTSNQANPEVNQPARRIQFIDQYNRPGNKTKIDPIAGETLDLTVQRALNDKRINKLVVVENGEVFMVNPKITTSQNIEVRLENGVIEKGPRKSGQLNGEGYRKNKNGDLFEGNFVEGQLNGNGKIEWTNGTKETGYFENGGLKNGKREFSNGIVSEGTFEGQYLVNGKKTTPTGEVYQGEFKLGDLRSGKIIAKDGTVIKEYLQGKEVNSQELNIQGFDLIRLNNSELSNIRKNEIIEIKTNDGSEYILKSLGRGEYEIIGGNNQKLGIKDGLINFPIEGGKIMPPKQIKEAYLLSNGELGVINFENVKSFEELYKELDRVGGIEIISPDGTKTKLSSQRVKEMIKKGETRYLPKELSIKVESLLQFTNGPKKISDRKNRGDTEIKNIITDLGNRGKQYDNMNISIDFFGPGMVKYHGTYSGRPIVEVKMPNGNSEFFYKSTGWAGKAGEGIDGTTNGMWQVYGGHANILSSQGPINNWFIKSSDYTNYYGSRTFGSIAKSLDGILMQKYGLNSTESLNQTISFQNKTVNTYDPG